MSPIDKDEPQRVLVTGVSGMIAHHFVDVLIRETAWTILGLHRRERRVLDFPGVGARYQEATGGFADWLKAVQDFKPVAIFHLAAMARPAACEEAPEETKRVNTALTRELFEGSKDFARFFQFISTDLVFEGVSRAGSNFSEGQRPVPESVYARSKVEAEDYLLQSGGPVCVLRTPLVLSAPGVRHAGCLSWVLQSALESRAIPSFEDEYRTPIHVRSLCAQMLGLASQGAEGVFHAAGTRRCNRVELFASFLDAFGLSNDWIDARRIPRSDVGMVRAADVSLNATKIRKALSLPTQSLEELTSQLWRDFCENFSAEEASLEGNELFYNYARSAREGE